jgi:ATP-binding protein involved in chromosome partitioning
MIEKEAVIEILKTIELPGTGRDIVDMDAVREVSIEAGRIAVSVELRGVEPGLKYVLEPRIRKALRERAPEAEITATVTVEQPIEREGPRPRPAPPRLIPGIRHPIAVASGKGGVGKSTVAVNLAYSLAAAGVKTGLFDADIYGPNIPRMLGIEGEVPTAENGKIRPIERNGLRVMSLGLIARRDQAVIWRGPMVSKAIEKMLADTLWGDIDYLVIDLPPGTGDAQLTLSQRIALTGAVMVTTPQSVSISDVRRGIIMFRDVNVPILGLVENMAYFTCASCGEKTEIFPGTEIGAMIDEFSLELLGRIPVDPRISAGGDGGEPIVLQDPESEAGAVFRRIAERLIGSVAPV